LSTKPSSKYRILEVNSKMLLDKLKGKKIIILDLEELSFIPYILPIYEALQKKSSAISYYVATHYKGDEALKVFDVPQRKQFDVDLSRKLSIADIFLSPHIYGVGNKKSTRIHINHNQPVKYESYQKEEFINFDVHFLTSPLHREQTENTIRKFDLGGDGIRLFNTGYSKSDALLQGRYNRDDVLTESGLNPALKTVLYAPSWDEGLSLRESGEKIIENILEIKNINLIVKLHPISYCPENGPNYLFYTGGINWIERLSKFNSHPNFRHIPSNDVNPLLSAGDVMVTDVSSVALEFIMLDKPVIYIDCPEFFEKTLKKTYSNFGDITSDFVRNDPKANAGRHTGTVVYNINELGEAIQKTIQNPGEFSAKRIEFAKRLGYNIGKAADVASQDILNILKI